MLRSTWKVPANEGRHRHRRSLSRLRACCASTCAPCCSAAVPIGTSAARSSEAPGRTVRRRVSFRTEKRRHNCWPNRSDRVGTYTSLRRDTQDISFPGSALIHVAVDHDAARPLDVGIVRALGLTYDNAIRATRAISKLSAVRATASRCRLTPFASAAHTKVWAIPSSNRRDAMRLVSFSPRVVYRWNRIARATELSSKQGSAMRLEKLQSPAISDKLVVARSRTIETALTSSPSRRGFHAGSVASLFARLSCSPPKLRPDHDNLGRKHHDPNQCYTTQQPGSRQECDSSISREFFGHGTCRITQPNKRN